MLDDTHLYVSTPEFDSLLALSRGIGADAIPPEHRRRLVNLGLVRRVGVEFLLTSNGRFRLMLGN
jgi:hypothetical protein